MRRRPAKGRLPTVVFPSLAQCFRRNCAMRFGRVGARAALPTVLHFASELRVVIEVASRDQIPPRGNARVDMGLQHLLSIHRRATSPAASLQKKVAAPA